MGYKTYELHFQFYTPILFLIQSGAVICDFMQIHSIKIVKFQKNKFNR